MAVLFSCRDHHRMGFGVKLMVVPAGTPKAERAIELLKPPLIAVARLAAP